MSTQPTPADRELAEKIFNRLWDYGAAAQLIADHVATAVHGYHDHYESICHDLTPEVWEKYNKPETTDTQWRVLALNAAAIARIRIQILTEASQDAYDASVNESTYPDGPCLPKHIRDALKAALSP